MSIIVHIGKPGSFSHAAARLQYGPDHTYIGVSSFAEVFRTVSSGDAEIGVVPIENSLAGSIYENYDLFNRYHVSICAEQYLKVEHYLLARKTAVTSIDRMRVIKQVYSHPKALEQCRDFFTMHPQMIPTLATDTATAAAMVAGSKDDTIGAIGSLESAHIYRLDVTARNIEDDSANYTRFVYIEQSQRIAPDSSKCALLFEVKHQPGSLIKVLEVINRHGLNITKIESRPIHGKPFEYQFYLDFEFTGDQRPTLDTILSEITQSSHRLKVLGVYKAGVLMV